MGRLFFGLLCVVWVSGCSSNAPTAATQCKPRSGTYAMAFGLVTAGCPVLAASTAVAGSPVTVGGGQPAGGCSNSGGANEDNCTVTFDVTCPMTEPLLGSVTWTQDGTSGSGTAETFDDAGTACDYDLTLTQQ